MEQDLFIQHVQMEEIPWNRLTTPYGRATDFPEYFRLLHSEDQAAANHVLGEIARHIEHQSTFWHATPIAVIFLVRAFNELVMLNSEAGNTLVADMLAFFAELAQEYCLGREMEHAEPLPCFKDMLSEEHLWSEVYDEEEDELRYEDVPFADDLFYSFYFYTYQVLLCNKTKFEKLRNDTEYSQLAGDLTRLLS